MIPEYGARIHEGHKGLIIGIANDQSIAWGCARAFRALGAKKSPQDRSLFADRS